MVHRNKSKSHAVCITNMLQLHVQDVDYLLFCVFICFHPSFIVLIHLLPELTSYKFNRDGLILP